MSGFLDKLKNGFAEAGTKAKIMVDVNRLKLQIAQERREVKESFESIGQVVFELYQAGNLSVVQEQIEVECQNILLKMEEIHLMEIKVIELNDEKECPDCKQVLEKEIRFCPECGYKFEDIAMNEEDGNEEM